MSSIKMSNHPTGSSTQQLAIVEGCLNHSTSTMTDSKSYLENAFGVYILYAGCKLHALVLKFSVTFQIPKPNELGALMKLQQEHPNMNLAQLAEALNMPLDQESMKFLGNLNPQALYAALLKTKDSTKDKSTFLKYIYNII